MRRDDRYTVKGENFKKIPGCLIAYWVNNQIIFHLSSSKKAQDYGEAKQGLISSDNSRLLRLWHEIDLNNTRWVPYNKGGGFRKWYGNNEYVLNWYNDGYEIKNFFDDQGNLRSRPQNLQYYFRESITWNDVSTASLCCRKVNNKFAFDASGPSFFPYNNDNLDFYLGLFNTKVAQQFLSLICQGLHYSTGHIPQIPVVIDDLGEVKGISSSCISISKTDWDSFETSWDFKTHPLVGFRMSGAYAWGDAKPTSRISSAFKAWELFAEGQFDKLKANEEELNRIFIDIYGLQDELTPEVEEKDVTIRKADLGRDIRGFISYAVGCMFGRYSLDEQGLVFAGGTFDKLRYKTYLPEEDNILPIGSADYFEDDIVVRFVEFVRTVYGNDTLSENLNFIADALYPTGNGSAQEKIRRYFLNDFYKDHLKIYQKRPIYWLLDSGKKDGFKALFYLHRYDKYTIARVRTDYLHPLQRKYEAEIKRLEMLVMATDNARDKAAYRKEIGVLQAKIDECRTYDQVVSHIAHQQIELDLDDGVKVNYEKFQGVKVPKDNGKTEKMVLLGKI
ncbi:MAG: BREX-1 system adenine-specific DNA-methyltransferase PglX [Clostridiaceae bacterium]|nr:BREX-1 system adenine-specific DNA-methyltransferase PglX [Clostridiaceae bacterium]